MTLKTPLPRWERHHTDPPRLWVSLIVGSFVIHLCAIWILHLLMVRQRTVDLTVVPISIELVATTPKPSSVKSPVPTQSVSSVARTISPLAQTKNSPAANSPTEKPLSHPLASNSPVVSPPPQPRQQISVKPTVNPREILPTSSQQNSAPRKIITPVAANPVTPALQTPKPTISPSPRVVSTTPSTPPKEPLADGRSSNSVRPPSSDSPPAQQKPPLSEPLPTRDVSVHQGSGGIVATLFQFHLANRGTDIPEKAAAPKQEKKKFSSIVYPSKRESNSDQVLVLEVVLLVDNAGKPEVLSTRVRQGNGNFQVNQFSQELIQDWQFEPAYQGGKPVASLLECQIRIAPIAN